MLEKAINQLSKIQFLGISDTKLTKMYPYMALAWYIGSCRASTDFLQAFNALDDQQIKALYKALLPIAGNYHKAVEVTKRRLKVQ